MGGNGRRNGRGASGAFGLAATLLALGLGAAAERPPAGWHPSPIAAPLPLPPEPPSRPATDLPAASPQPLVAAPATRSGPAAACSQSEASAKAARLFEILQTLIAHDPDRARGLLDQFQQAVQRLAQHSASLGETCRSYDALIAQAGK